MLIFLKLANANQFALSLKNDRDLINQKYFEVQAKLSVSESTQKKLAQKHIRSMKESKEIMFQLRSELKNSSSLSEEQNVKLNQLFLYEQENTNLKLKIEELYKNQKTSEIYLTELNILKQEKSLLEANLKIASKAKDDLSWLTEQQTAKLNQHIFLEQENANLKNKIDELSKIHKFSEGYLNELSILRQEKSLLEGNMKAVNRANEDFREEVKQLKMENKELLNGNNNKELQNFKLQLENENLKKRIENEEEKWNKIKLKNYYNKGGIDLERNNDISCLKTESISEDYKSMKIENEILKKENFQMEQTINNLNKQNEEKILQEIHESRKIMEKYRASLNSEKIKEIFERSRTPANIDRLEEALMEGQKKMEMFFENARSFECRVCEEVKGRNAVLVINNETLSGQGKEKEKV